MTNGPVGRHRHTMPMINDMHERLLFRYLLNLIRPIPASGAAFQFSFGCVQGSFLQLFKASGAMISQRLLLTGN
jgi:hypothetical protein